MRKRQSISNVTADSWGLPPRRTSEADLDITPMIDVTFLLLIFFMVTSTMKGNPDRQIPVAEHGAGIDPARATIIRIQASGIAGPMIELDGQPATLDDVRPFVEQNVEESRRMIVIKADREVPHGFVQQVAKTVSSIDDVTFSFGVRDKPVPR
jgi:biopolymer transport protein ExbD